MRRFLAAMLLVVPGLAFANPAMEASRPLRARLASLRALPGRAAQHTQRALGLGDLDQLDAEIATATPGSHKDKLELDRARTLEKLSARSGALFVSPHMAADAPRLLHLVERERARGGVYAVSSPSGLGPRAFRDATELELHGRFAIEQLTGEEAALLKHALSTAQRAVGRRALYAQEGIEGLADLLESPLVAHRLTAAGRLSEVQVGALAERLRTLASDHSLRSVSVKTGQLPLEAQYVFAKQPKLREELTALEADGVRVAFFKAERTPDDVLVAINRIAVLSQENFLTTWLPQLLKDGKRPNLKPTEQGLVRAREAGLIGHVDGEAAIVEQLDKDVDLITHAATRLTGVVVHDPKGVARGFVKRFDDAMADVARDHAAHRMLFDNANERTSEAQEVIKKMMLIGPVAHVLEHADLGVAAKIFAGSADDILGEYAEIKALLGSGFSKKEVAKRLVVAAPVLGAATWAAGQVQSLLHQGREVEAGALFGASAVALSLTTAIQSMAMYKRAYDVLLAEGKIDGKVGPLVRSKAFQKAFSAFGEGGDLLEPERRPALIALVRQHLERDPRLEPEDVARVVEALEHLDFDEVRRRVTGPGQLARWKAAIAQDFSNPARLGLMIGASVAPLIGALGGKAGLLSNGFALAAIGSGEAIISGTVVFAADRIADLREHRALERKIAALSVRSTVK